MPLPSRHSDIIKSISPRDSTLVFEPNRATLALIPRLEGTLRTLVAFHMQNLVRSQPGSNQARKQARFLSNLDTKRQNHGFML